MNDTPPPTRRHDPDHADQKSAMEQLAAQAETVTAHRAPGRDPGRGAVRRVARNRTWCDVVRFVALTLVFAAAAVAMWAGGAGAVAVGVFALGAALTVPATLRPPVGSAPMMGAAIAGRGRAITAVAEDDLVARFGEWRARYARDRVADPANTSAVVAIAASLPDPRPVFTAARRARHEAGHAVIALARDAAIASANIRLVGRVGGGVRWTGYPRASRADHLWDILVIGLAGHVVDVDAGHWDDGCASGDLAAVHGAAFELVVNGHRPDGYDGPLELWAVVEAARSEVRRITAERSDAIDRVSAGLVERQYLRDWQVRALADPVEHSGAAPWWFPRDSVTANGADHVHVSVEGHGDGDGLPITGAAGDSR